MSGSNGSNGPEGSSSTNTSSGTSTNASAAAAAEGAASSPEISVVIDETTEGDPQTCAAEVRVAENVALDIYVMLDVSASMLDALPAAQNQLDSKWEAIRSSLSDFVMSEDSSDIGIGLQYFPILEEGVPDDYACTSNDDCGGAAGPCSNNYCVTPTTETVSPPGQSPFDVEYFLGPAEVPEFCASSMECTTAGDVCMRVNGLCTADGFLTGPDTDVLRLISCEYQGDCPTGTICEQVGLCEFVQAACTNTIACPDGGGRCLGIPDACVNGIRCETADYATPAVEISRGEERNTSILGSLSAQEPVGLTPTAPALDGAVQHARQWAEQNPAHQVVTVLATDGFPTECSPLEIPDIAVIAADSAAGSPSIKTFVIGVFSEIDLAGDGLQRLNELARAGDTETAFIVDTGRDVAAQFLQALQAIRNKAVSCEFQLPDEDPDNPLDLGEVNVRYTDAQGATRQLYNVADAEACAGAEAEGWYYDTASESGETTQITVCPGVCEAFEAGDGARIELQIGCETIVR